MRPPHLRLSLSRRATDTLGYPDIADAHFARYCFWTARLLFLVSLCLPAMQWSTWGNLGSEPSTPNTLFGVQCLVFGFLSPANHAIAFGLFRSSRQRRFAGLGVMTSLFGFLCCLAIWGLVASFGVTMREGFFCWLAVPLIQLFGFAAQVNAPPSQGTLAICGRSLPRW